MEANLTAIPYWIESLIFSFKDSIVGRVGAERTVYYHFLESVPTSWSTNNTGFTPFNENQRSFLRSVFDYFSSIIDLKFVETKVYDSFNTIVLGNNDQGGSGSAGYMTGAPGDQAWGLFISNVHPNASSLLNPQGSAWVPQIYVHELGHVLGLKHPFGNTLPILSDAEDNFDLTVMTYGSRSPGIPAPTSILLQPLDIAALQYLYGPSKTAANATRDDTYALNENGRNFIWDGGGTDKLDASAATVRVVLDLEPLSRSYFGAAPSALISADGQIMINAGTVIEQVLATRFDDILFGNTANNVIWTNAGVDYVNGRGGADTVVVDAAYSSSQLFLEGDQLAIALGAGNLVRLENVEIVRFADGERAVADLKKSATSVPYATIGDSPSSTITSAFDLRFEFNETVTGLTASDFTVTNGQIAALNGSGSSYVVTVTPSALSFGTLSLKLNSSSVTASSGLMNLPTATKYFVFDTKPVALAPGNDAATVTNGTIVIRFEDAFSLGPGDIIIQTAAGAQIERLTRDDAGRVYQKGTALYLDLKAQVADGAVLKVILPAGTIVDANGNTTAYSVSTAPNSVVETNGTAGADSRNLGPLADIFRGLDGDDRIWGEEGEDFIDGGPGNDRLNGMQGDDTLLGGDGDDLLIGGTGDDIFDGGPGSDTVEYQNIVSTDAEITRNASGYVIKTSRDGMDRLRGVEAIKFADKLLTLERAINSAPQFLTGNGNKSSNAVSTPTVKEDEAGTFGLSVEDVDGDALTFSVTQSPGFGSASIISGKTPTGEPISGVRYTPSPNFNGSDKLIVTVSDGKGGTATQTFNITVTPVNDAPVFGAAIQAISAAAGTAKNITLSATDVDGDALTYTAATPGKGVASISGNTLTYTPRAGAWGTDSFVVTASDGKGGTATQTINVTVLAATATKAFTVTTLPGWVGSIGGNGSVVGSNGFEDITVLFGQVALDGSFNRGGDIVRVSGNADSYLIGRTSASNAYIEAETSKVAIPIGSTGMGIVFSDGVRKLGFAGGAYKIGSQTFTADPSKITSTSDGTALPTGADPTAQAIVTMLSAGLSGGKAPDLTITGKARIVGTNGVDVIKVGSTGGDLVFDGSFNRGGDIIVLNKAAGDYSAAKFNASTIVITSGIEKLTIPMGTTGLTLRFTDGDRTLVFENGAFYIGEQAFNATTATQLTPSAIALSADQGVQGSSVILDATGKAIITDDTTKTSNVIVKNFGSDDVIRVTGATASQYNFAISDADPKDLEITYTDAATSATNRIVLDDVIKVDAFIANYQTAATALGWNFMTFG